MSYILVKIFALVVFSSLVQKYIKIPAHLTVFTIAIGSALIGLPIIDPYVVPFDMIFILSLPVLLACESLKIKLTEVKSQLFNLFWVGSILVIAITSFGVLLTPVIFPDHHIGLAAAVTLFAILALTDPLTINSFFSCYRIPNQLQTLPKYECIFNETTAFTLFVVGIVALGTDGTVSPSLLISKILTVSVGSFVLGVLGSHLIVLCLKFSEDPLAEMSILLLGIYTTFTISELFHFSALLTVVTTTIFAFYMITKSTTPLQLHKKYYIYTSWWHKFLSKPITTTQSKHEIEKNMEYLASLLGCLVLISVANLVSLKEIWEYKYEIIMVFLLTTFLRALFMLKFAIFGKDLKSTEFSCERISWAFFTFLGNKGALSILLTHMIPDSYPLKSMFSTLVLGLVVLSTFVYALFLIFIVFHYRKVLSVS